MSMTPNEEILSIIRYAPGPIGAAAIYEQCKSIENINDVSSRMSQLFAQGKVDRVEITTTNNRKGYAYTLPKAHAAPQGDAGIPASGAAAAEAAPAAAAPAAAPAQRKKPGRKPKAAPKDDPVAKALDQVEAALKDSPPPAPAAANDLIEKTIKGAVEETVRRLKGLPTMRERGRGDPAPAAPAPAPADAAALADAIIARLRRQLAPPLCELEVAAGPDRLHVNIHIEQVDIHLGGL